MAAPAPEAVLLNTTRTSGAQFDAGVEQLGRKRVRLTAEDALAARVDTQRTNFLRAQELHRLKREILTDDILVAQKVLVAKM